MCKRLCLSLMLAALAFLSAACDRKLPDNFSGAADKTDIGRPESTPVSENASVSDILPVSTAPALPKTTAAAAPSPDSEPSQTTALNHLFHDEQAEVYQAVWDFLLAKESNTVLWQNEYVDLYQFFAGEKTADGSLRYPLPLINLVKLDWVRRERSRCLNFEKTDFSFGLAVERISAENGTAEVALESGVHFRYIDRSEPSFTGNDYEIFLKKIDGKWLIYDVVTRWDFLSDEYREKEFDEVAYLEETVGIHDARPAPVPPEA